MASEQSAAEITYDPAPPIRHVYPYTPDLVVRPGMKALCGYKYEGEPYDGTTADVKSDCIVCEDLVRVKRSQK